MTFRICRKIKKSLARDERGTAFIMVLILLLTGGLIIAPLLNFTATGLTTTKVYETETYSLYAADAGVEDGLWQIKYDEMQSFPTYDPLAFYAYDSSYEWSYEIAGNINDALVDVNIRNVWVPKNISAPSLSSASGIIESGKLKITGTRTVNNNYRINLSFAPANAEEKENLTVQSIGIYLPPGYHYVIGSSNLEDDPLALWYSVPTVENHASNEAVIWSFGTLKFEDLPPVGSTETASITFDYTSDTGANLQAVSWIKTTGVEDIPFSWDVNHKFYRIIAGTDDSIVDSYIMLPGAENLNIFGGALVSNGDINLAKDGVISGDIIYEGSFTYQEPFTHTDGDILETVVDLPSAEDNADYANDIKLEAQSTEVWVGDYDIGIGNGVDVTNLGPIYISQDLHIAKDNIINFQGPVFVEGNIDMDKDAEFTGGGVIIAVGNIYLAKTNDFGSVEDSLIMSLEGNITFKKEILINALIYGPAGSITFDKSAVVNGSVIGDSIQADKEGNFTQNYAYYDGIHLPGYTSEPIRTITWESD